MRRPKISVYTRWWEDIGLSENTEAIQINKAKRTNLFNPRTRTGRGTRLCRRHLDRPYPWRSIHVAVAPVSGRIEVTLSAPLAPDHGTIAATSASRDPDPYDTSVERTASPGFCRHERFLVPGADHLYVLPRICRHVSQVFAVDRCRCAFSDRTRYTAADSICCRVARRNRCRYHSNARLHRSRKDAGLSYRSTSCHWGPSRRPTPTDRRTYRIKTRLINNNNYYIAKFDFTTDNTKKHSLSILMRF